MKTCIVALTVLLACFYAANAGTTCQVVSSTAKIIGRLCYKNFGANRSNATMLKDFFGCYDQAPGKPQFVKCQTQTWGGPLDNVDTVRASCSNQLKLPGYGSCLRTEFKNAGIDMNAAVLKLNDCQSKVLGIN